MSHLPPLGPALIAALLLGGCLGPPQLPAPEVQIEPPAPGPDDDLILVLEEIPTGEGRPDLEWRIEWRVDGVVVGDLPGARAVEAARTAPGERWTAVVRFQLGEDVGSPDEASVQIGADGDDDSATDDDDSTTDDDDSGDDDSGGDDDVQPGPPSSRLCAAAGTLSNAAYSLTTCTGPLEAAPGVSSNSVYTLVVGTFRVLADPE